MSAFYPTFLKRKFGAQRTIFGSKSIGKIAESRRFESCRGHSALLNDNEHGIQNFSVGYETLTSSTPLELKGDRPRAFQFKMRILFICKHNRFRSKVSEAIFNYYNENSEIKAESAGMVERGHPVSEIVQKAMAERGFKIRNKTPRQVNDKIISRSDLIIIAADDVNRKFFEKHGKNVIVWKIPDVFFEEDYDGISKRIDMIERRIKELITSFKK